MFNPKIKEIELFKEEFNDKNDKKIKKEQKEEKIFNRNNSLNDLANKALSSLIDDKNLIPYKGTPSCAIKMKKFTKD
jgi:hypothetical protein